MLAGAQSQNVAVGHAKCIALTRIAYKPLKISAKRFGPWTWCMSKNSTASYDFQMSLKSIFNLVLAVGDMLAGAQSQIVAAGHAKCIKLTTSA
jgi:hypothetical protein